MKVVDGSSIAFQVIRMEIQRVTTLLTHPRNLQLVSVLSYKYEYLFYSLSSLQFRLHFSFKSRKCSSKYFHLSCEQSSIFCFARKPFFADKSLSSYYLIFPNIYCPTTISSFKGPAKIRKINVADNRVSLQK